MFEDQTKLEIGALSEVVLDRFVYDPNRSNSEVAVSVAKGIARFTTGVLAHESYKINTPTATIGVRGTTLDLQCRRARDMGLCRGRLGNGHRERGHGHRQCRAGDIRPAGGAPSKPFNTPSPPFDTTQMYALIWNALTPGIITSLTQLGTGIPVVIQNNCVSQSSSTCD